MILIGGDETTRHVISGGMYQLLLHPDQQKKLVGNPASSALAIEEMLRWVTPFQNMMRTVTRDTELRGVPLREGSRLLLLYPSANRDEAVFDRPDEFDVERDPNPPPPWGLEQGVPIHIARGPRKTLAELRAWMRSFI